MLVSGRVYLHIMWMCYRSEVLSPASMCITKIGQGGKNGPPWQSHDVSGIETFGSHANCRRFWAACYLKNRLHFLRAKLTCWGGDICDDWIDRYREWWWWWWWWCNVWVYAGICVAHSLYVIVFTSRLAVFPPVTQQTPPRSTWPIPYPWNATRPINCWITSPALTSNLVGSP